MLTSALEFSLEWADFRRRQPLPRLGYHSNSQQTPPSRASGIILTSSPWRGSTHAFATEPGMLLIWEDASRKKHSRLCASASINIAYFLLSPRRTPPSLPPASASPTRNCRWSRPVLRLSAILPRPHPSRRRRRRPPPAVLHKPTHTDIRTS